MMPAATSAIVGRGEKGTFEPFGQEALIHAAGRARHQYA